MSYPPPGRGHCFGHYHIMVLKELPWTVNVGVRTSVLRHASPRGRVLPFQGRVSLVVGGPAVKQECSPRGHHNGALIRHIRLLPAPHPTPCLHGFVALHVCGGLTLWTCILIVSGKRA